MKAKEEFEIIPNKKNKTLKKRRTKTELVGEKIQIETNDFINKDKNKDNCVESVILQIVEKFQCNGISVLESLNEKQLTNIIHIANTKYYNQTPIMSDSQYDIIKEFSRIITFHFILRKKSLQQDLRGF